MRKIILFIGAPGSGKGSRCEECRKSGYIHISSSQLLADAGYDLSKGGFGISDKEVVKLILKKLKTLSKNAKIVLEGFPRRVEQAELLSKCLNIEQVIYLEITKETAWERVKNRLVCPNCKITYSKSYRPPIKEGICDECGTQLLQRASDTKNVFCKRFRTFEDNACQTILYYRTKGVCVKTINAEEDFNIVSIIENENGFV